MAEINFLPVCMNCRNILSNNTIDCKWEGLGHVIEPDRCPYCGKSYTAIRMPMRLPFKEKKKMTENKNEKVDNVNHPSHYADNCSLECFDVMLLILGPVGTFDFCLGNVFKYLWRHNFKNGEEDVNKAGWYLTKAEMLYSKYKDNELFNEEKVKLDQLTHLYKQAKEYYME